VAPGLENRDYSRGYPLRWPRDTLYPQNLALTSPKSGGRSVGIVRLRTTATEFSFLEKDIPYIKNMKRTQNDIIKTKILNLGVSYNKWRTNCIYLANGIVARPDQLTSTV
jgi:hypothetical protein